MKEKRFEQKLNIPKVQHKFSKNTDHKIRHLTDYYFNDIFELSNMYSKLFQLHSKLLKSLAHSKRLEIIQLLREHSLPVHDIQEMLDLPQANLSQHLRILRGSGVVKTKRDGKHIYYSIGHTNFIKASDLFREILIENNKDELSDVMFKKMTDLVPLTQDPVCKMRISPKTAAFAYKRKYNEFYFCGSGCLKKFQKNIKRYTKEMKK